MNNQERSIEVPKSPGIPSESYRSPERRYRQSNLVQSSPKRFSTPLTGIKLTIIDLKMSQQATVHFTAVRCSVSIDQRMKAFESSQYVLNDKKYEIQFNFNPSMDYDYFKIGQDWKRITAKLEVFGQSDSNDEVYIDAMGVSNVPYATEWSNGDRSERWSGVVGIAMMSGNSKIGEVRVLIETQLEGFFEDSASEDGDYSATPSPMTPGRANNPRYSSVSMALSSSIKSPIRREFSSPVQLKWDPSSAVKSSVQEYSRSQQNSPNKTSHASAASPARNSLMSPSREPSRSLLDAGSPRSASTSSSAVTPTLFVPSLPAAGALLDDDPPETESVTAAVSEVVEEVGDNGSESSDDIVLLNTSVQEIVESGRTDDAAVLAALDAVLENIQASNPGSPVRSSGTKKAPFFGSDPLPSPARSSPVRTATVTSYAHTPQGDLVYAPREMKSASTSPMVPERTTVGVGGTPAAAVIAHDASTSPVKTPSVVPKRTFSSYLSPPATPLTPIQESDPYADGQTSFTTTPINGAAYAHPFTSTTSSSKSPLIDQFASVSASAALLQVPDTSSSVEGRSGLTSEAESVQSEEPSLHHRTPLAIDGENHNTYSSPERGNRFLRSTPHKRRPLSEGGYGGRGYRSADEEQRSHVLPAISLSLFYTYVLVVLMVFGSMVFPHYASQVKSLLNLKLVGPSESNGETKTQLVTIAAKNPTSPVSSTKSLHLSTSETPLGVRVLLKDKSDGSCLVWKQAPWWKGGSRAEYQQCNDNSWWTVLPTEGVKVLRDLRIQHSSGLCLSANTCRSGKYNTNRRESLKLRSCDAASTRCVDNWRLDHNYLGRGVRANWEKVVNRLTTKPVATKPSQQSSSQESQQQLQHQQQGENGTLVSFPHPMCLGRENDQAYLIPCAASSIDNSSYRNTQLIAVQAFTSSMTKAKSGRFGVEEVELDSITMG